MTDQKRQSSWETGKQDHIKLSDAAASIYDQLYAKSNFATHLYMQKEEDIIRDVASKTADLRIALDLGSGTGRDSVVLARKFDQVFGYDFSEGMVGQADQRRLRERQGNIAFRLRDIEVEGLPHRSSSVGLVNTGFGMGSFLENPNDLLKEIRRVLVPQGYTIYSFYNRNSIASQIQTKWKPSLAAMTDNENDCLNVTLPDNSVFQPSAKTYTVKEVRMMLEQYFNVISLQTYPTVTALLPQEIFDHSLAGELFEHVDQNLAGNLEKPLGHYIIAVCQKAGKLTKSKPTMGFEKAFQLMKLEGLLENIRRHAPIRTMKDAERVISEYRVERDHMLKSVLVSEKLPNDEAYNPLVQPRLWLAVTQATQIVDFGKFAKLVGVSRENLQLAKLSVLEDFTGFTVGAVPPFAMPKTIPVLFDSPIENLSHVWCGTGDPSQSIKIPVQKLEKMATCSYHSISKDGAH